LTKHQIRYLFEGPHLSVGPFAFPGSAMSNMKIISIMDAENKQQSQQVKADIEEAMLVLDAKIDSVRRALARVDERVKVLEEAGVSPVR